MLIFIVKQYRLGLFFVELQFVFLQPEGYVARALLNFTFGCSKSAVWFYCDRFVCHQRSNDTVDRAE